MSGVYLIVFKVLVPNLNTGNGTALAGMLALLAAMAWGSATSFGKYVLHKVSFGTMAFLRFSLASLFAFILFGIFSAVQAVTGAKDIFGKAHNLNQLFSLTTAQWENLVLIVLISGAGAMLVYYFGLKQTKARVATICELAWPASSLVIGILFFKNTFNVTQIVGIVLLIAAMISISVTQRGKDVVIPEKEV
jgi:drug/metabolite transporter (DMT)-like permease